jgi:hypothetical protein
VARCVDRRCQSSEMETPANSAISIHSNTGGNARRGGVADVTETSRNVAAAVSKSGARRCCRSCRTWLMRLTGHDSRNTWRQDPPIRSRRY